MQLFASVSIRMGCIVWGSPAFTGEKATNIVFAIFCFNKFVFSQFLALLIASAAFCRSKFQVSPEHIKMVSSAYDMMLHSMFLFSKSLINSRNRVGPNTVPCGTPVSSILLVLRALPIFTYLTDIVLVSCRQYP